jgi:hypothetical protein
LVFGILGVLGLFIPQGGMSLFGMLKAFGATGQAVLMLIAFALPAVMGGLAVAKPPLQKWQAGVALAGFALASYKLEIWKVLPHIGELFKAIPMLLLVVACIGGLVVSILGLAKGDAK